MLLSTTIWEVGLCFWNAGDLHSILYPNTPNHWGALMLTWLVLIVIRTALIIYLQKVPYVQCNVNGKYLGLNANFMTHQHAPHKLITLKRCSSPTWIQAWVNGDCSLWSISVTLRNVPAGIRNSFIVTIITMSWDSRCK